MNAGSQAERLRALAASDDVEAAAALWRLGRRANDQGWMQQGAQALWRLGGWRGEGAAACALGPSHEMCNDVAWFTRADADADAQRWVGVARGGGYYASEAIGATLPWWMGLHPRALESAGGLPVPPCWGGEDTQGDVGERARRTLAWALRDLDPAFSRDVGQATQRVHAAPTEGADEAPARAWMLRWMYALHALIQRWAPTRTPHFTLEGMLSQVSALRVCGHQVSVGHIGLGWVYRLRGGEAVALTQPHNIARTLRDAGVASLEHPQFAQYASLCAQAIGVGGALTPDVLTVELDPSDRFLLCSRGLHDALGTERLLGLWRGAPDPQGACARLLAEAAQAPGARSLGCACFDVADAVGMGRAA